MIPNPREDIFGRWSSTIHAPDVAAGGLRFGRVQADGNSIYWSEGRPADGGRAVIVRWTAEEGAGDILPPPYSARSRVHEYGGGEFLIANATLYFVNDADQAVYAMPLAEATRPEAVRQLTRECHTRFADFALDKTRNRLIAVAERHNAAQPEGLPENFICAIALGDGALLPLHRGHDFYAHPRLNADGTKFAFLAWNLPDMPWDAAALYIGELSPRGNIASTVRVAGGGGTACFQPEWGPDGNLYFIWDTDGFGNLFRWEGAGKPQQVTHLKAELSMPLWSLNARSYAFVGGSEVYLTFIANGDHGCGIFDLDSGVFVAEHNAVTSSQSVVASGYTAIVLGLTDTSPSAIQALGNPRRAKHPAPEILRKSSVLDYDNGYIRSPTRLTFPSPDGSTVSGLLYAPANPSFTGPDGALPPLIINLHGGPTTATARGLKPRTLYFTSRGFAWLDLDYAGSTGYGRAFRERLRGRWGIADVADTVAAATYVAANGLANPDAIFVTGGSAGGYTVLMVIAASNVFRGAASYYGICDLAALQRTTHKFEQGYLAGLLGTRIEDDPALYAARSAITHIENIRTPLILFQGADDKVVPPEQSAQMFEALQARGITSKYHLFEGEGHGFRKAETVKRTLDLELEFFRRLLPLPAPGR